MTSLPVKRPPAGHETKAGVRPHAGVVAIDAVGRETGLLRLDDFLDFEALRRTALHLEVDSASSRELVKTIEDGRSGFRIYVSDEDDWTSGAVPTDLIRVRRYADLAIVGQLQTTQIGIDTNVGNAHSCRP